MYNNQHNNDRELTQSSEEMGSVCSQFVVRISQFVDKHGEQGLKQKIRGRVIQQTDMKSGTFFRITV